MSQERWDIVLKILDGPLAGGGEQVCRGPVVRIGADPGPGGFRLDGYRGLDARHATLTAYDGGSATCAPIGTNQVRMAPHSNVSWKDIDPMGGPEYLSEGCCLHLGPVGRGITLEFVECRRLGVWAGGALSSEYAGPQGGGQPGIMGPGIPGAPPAAFDARKTKQIRSSSVPAWFIGCMVLMTAVFVTVPLVFVFVNAISIERLGPVDEGEDFYKFATVAKKDINPALLGGLKEPFYEFVMRPNIDASKMSSLDKPEAWDTELYDKVAASLQTHIAAWNVFKRLDIVREDYAAVLEVMRKEGLPDVFAGIPYLESRYDPNQTSVVCAQGYWQFMPEVAFRVTRDSDVTLRVQDCKFSDNDFLYTPDKPTPPVGVMKNAPYMLDGRCRIKSCRVDDRKDLERSTEAAAFTLGEAFEDDDLRASGAVVQIAILSHNAGYDDSRFGVRKKSNMRDAWFAWSKGRDKDEWPHFYGANITTASPAEESWKGSVIHPEAQHYGYTIIAEHFLAVCYYGQNYADEIKAFKDYRRYTTGKGYCGELNIPTADEVRKHKAKGK